MGLVVCFILLNLIILNHVIFTESLIEERENFIKLVKFINSTIFKSLETTTPGREGDENSQEVKVAESMILAPCNGKRKAFLGKCRGFY